MLPLPKMNPKGEAVVNIDYGKFFLFGILTVLVIIGLAIYSYLLSYEILKPYLVEEIHQPFIIND
ncbi:hypothetical protein CD29_05400 [Ureibacillus manganicus DSM 26584]|uniref:Uncharacterized protein n=1 Tax=Ureibacillus manganicus DSM 26584 TaxID=1384049 RepID=A0A0A3I469_9BACL|nr:hypothetical protein CD29_05400 [Ureibacillus manganicus DSM 26584]